MRMVRFGKIAKKSNVPSTSDTCAWTPTSLCSVGWIFRLPEPYVLQISELGYAVLGYLDYARLVYASLSHIRLREILSLQLLIA